MARTKIHLSSLQKCLDAITDNLHVKTAFLDRIEQVKDSRGFVTLVQVEQTFMKISEQRQLMFHLLTEIENFGQSKSESDE